jgi:ADP-ribosyl-[dinitrogen reductase] hydrolase
MNVGSRSRLTAAQLDRAAGVLLGLACGDALGAGYEFGPPLAAETPVLMEGGGSFGWTPGEWTDDTSMAVPLAEAAAQGHDLLEDGVLDVVAARWMAWASEARDVGVQTSRVLHGAARPTSKALAAAALDVHERMGRSGGNGSLMRTAPIALAYLHNPEGLAVAARRVSELTHFDPEAGDACVLWCLAIRHAVLHGTFEGVRSGLEAIPEERRALWASRLDEAQRLAPSAFDRNGWVVQALQGAWSAISRTPVPEADPSAGVVPSQHLRLALEAAVRGGRDTDTVAAIAGGLLGARWGASAVPGAWRRILHGWPGLWARDLVQLGVLAAQGGTDLAAWPAVERVDYSPYGEIGALARHPFDDGVWLGGAGALDALPSGVDAVVSLCRVGTATLPGLRDHIEVWLIDSPDIELNSNLDAVLVDAADTVAALRADGRTVLLHCVQAQSRTPTVAALYAVRHCGVGLDEALDSVVNVLPAARPNAGFIAALSRLTAGGAE